MSPRYETEEVRLTLWLNSDELNLKQNANIQYRVRYVQSWWISIKFDYNIIEYIEFIPDDTKWGTIRSLYTIDESNNNGLIEIWGSKIGQLLNTNDPNVTVGYFKFIVKENNIIEEQNIIKLYHLKHYQ